MKQGFEPGCINPKLGQQRGVKIAIPCQQNEPRNRRYASERHVGRTKREDAGRDRRKFPGGPLLNLDEHRRERIQKMVIRYRSPRQMDSPPPRRWLIAVIDGHDLILETCKSGTCQTELPSPRGFTPDKSSPVLSSSLDAGMLPPVSRDQDHYRDLSGCKPVALQIELSGSTLCGCSLVQYWTVAPTACRRKVKIRVNWLKF